MDRKASYRSSVIDSLETVGVISAYNENDAAALQGLVARGKALQLDQGTKLSIVDTNEGMASVLIQSGSQTGERCFV